MGKVDFILNLEDFKKFLHKTITDDYFIINLKNTEIN